jgi:hypothetical protein
MMFFVVVLAAGCFYAYQQGFFNAEIEKVEQNVNAICDPSQEDCSDFEEDLEA